MYPAGLNLTETTMSLILASLLLLACSDDEPTLQPPASSDERGDRGGDDSSDERDDERDDSSNADYCYEQGWWDCYDYYEPDASYWGCTGSDASAYELGFCDCEAYYQDWYYCA